MGVLDRTNPNGFTYENKKTSDIREDVKDEFKNIEKSKM
jgi:hypothetical protein